MCVTVHIAIADGGSAERGCTAQQQQEPVCNSAGSIQGATLSDSGDLSSGQGRPDLEGNFVGCFLNLVLLRISVPGKGPGCFVNHYCAQRQWL